MRLRLFCLVSVFTLFASPAGAQPGTRTPPVLVVGDSGTLQRIQLRDGSELIGRITAIGDTTVQFQSSIGVTTIRRSEILNAANERGGMVRNGAYYFPNPNATRLVFAPTGRMLNQGEGYFSDYWVFFPGVAFGISNNVTLGGGMSIFPGADEQIFYFTPKVGVLQSPKVNVAVGALFASVTDNSAGILYGVGTWGEPDASFTAGLGYGFANGDLASTPAVVIGGESRVSPRVSFVTENYLLPGGSMILAGGLRFMGRGLSFDLALANFKESGGESFCCPPFIGFVYNFR
jgi:hypothetical protein